MFQNMVPVNAQRHAAKKIKSSESYAFASQIHIAYVTLHEFARAAAIYPVVFIEDRQQDEFRPVVLLGLNAGENLFVDEAGKWRASYVPAIIRRYPFALSATGEASDGQFLVCVDESCNLLNDEEGTALFSETGEPTQVLENVKRYLGELQQMDTITRQFTKFLTENNMLTPLNMRVRENDQTKNISGCYVINEERFNNLSDEKFMEMRKNRYLGAVFAQLISLSQVERLVMLKEERNPAQPA